MGTYGIIFYLFENRIQSETSVVGYLSGINDVMERGKKSSKKVRNGVKVENIVSAVELVRRMVNCEVVTHSKTG
jgi:hypothetical protein